MTNSHHSHWITSVRPVLSMLRLTGCTTCIGQNSPAFRRLRVAADSSTSAVMTNTSNGMYNDSLHVNSEFNFAAVFNIH